SPEERERLERIAKLKEQARAKRLAELEARRREREQQKQAEQEEFGDMPEWQAKLLLKKRERADSTTSSVSVSRSTNGDEDVPEWVRNRRIRDTGVVESTANYKARQRQLAEKKAREEARLKKLAKLRKKAKKKVDLPPPSPSLLPPNLPSLQAEREGLTPSGSSVSSQAEEDW
ncbi:MAG: hypothetical protein MHM6MM_009272, partial [Cercozoa sp. M6MM]